MPLYEIGDQHSHFPELTRYQTEEFYRNLYSFVFVRHPLTWYQSRWAFRVKVGWSAKHPLDMNCASNDFETFVNRCIDYKPDGWVSWLYRQYIDAVPGGIGFVGRVEYMIEDLQKVFKAIDEPPYDKRLKSIRIINDSNLKTHTGSSKPSKYWAKYTDKLIDRVLAVEQDVISRYYNNFSFDPKTLSGLPPY